MTADIERYLEGQSESFRTELSRIRTLLTSIVPGAEEGFSYGLQAIIVSGRPVVAYGATKKHCALYPLNGDIVGSLGDELAGFQTSKGTIRFSPDNPLPDDLIRRIVALRLAEIG